MRSREQVRAGAGRRAATTGALVALVAVLAGCGVDAPTYEVTSDELRRQRCGNGVCSWSETCSTCAADCGVCQPPTSCGDGTCNGGETCATCAGDCGVCSGGAGRIAFVSDRAGVARIYVANGDGSGVTPLTTGGSPAWSPDGRRIAFNRGSDLYVIDANGANERFVKAGALEPTWSPDGTRIAYQSGVGSGGGIYVMNADGSATTLLISHEFASPGWGDYCACSPAWSPDGATIAFIRANYDEGSGLYTMNADGTGSPSFLSNGWSQANPAWSPDGSRVSFDSAGFDGDQIGSLARTGGGYQTHAKAGPGGYIGESTWSPDGRSLAFGRSNGVRGTPTRIHVVRGDGSVGQLIPEAQSPANAAYSDREPAWSRGP